MSRSRPLGDETLDERIMDLVADGLPLAGAERVARAELAKSFLKGERAKLRAR